MKYIKKIKTVDVFETTKTTLNLPNVNLIEETYEVNYLPYVETPVETRLICIFSPYTIEEPTDLISIYHFVMIPSSRDEEEVDISDVFSAIEIDNVEQSNLINSYQFNTEDDHTVKYTLIDPTTIVEGCFGGYVDYDLPIKSVIIPNSVTSIGDCSFEYCLNLNNITFGNNLTNIGNNAFSNTDLENIILPNSLINIGDYAFCDCWNLTNVTIGNNVASIGQCVFLNCNNLESIIINTITPPTLGEKVFEDTNNCPIYVPAESVDIYKAASNWSEYASRIEAIQ